MLAGASTHCMWVGEIQRWSDMSSSLMAGNVHSGSLDFPKTCSLHGALILHWPSTTAALLQQLFVAQTTVLRVGVSVLEIQKRPPSRGQGVPQTDMETTPPTNSGLSCSIRWIVEEFLGKAAVFSDLLGNGGWKKLQKYSPNGCLMVIYHAKKQKITLNKHKLWDRFHEKTVSSDIYGMPRHLSA